MGPLGAVATLGHKKTPTTRNRFYDLHPTGWGKYYHVAAEQKTKKRMDLPEITEMRGFCESIQQGCFH